MHSINLLAILFLFTTCLFSFRVGPVCVYVCVATVVCGVRPNQTEWLDMKD